MVRRQLIIALCLFVCALASASFARAQSSYTGDGCAQTGLVGFMHSTGILGSRSDCCCLKGDCGGKGCKGGCVEQKCCRYKAPPCCGHSYGCHDCCHCGCACAGYCNWCGHGKQLGDPCKAHLRYGLLPKCERYRMYADRCNAAWYGGGYGYGAGGYWGGAGGYWGGPGVGPDGCSPYLGGGYDTGYQPDLFYNFYAPQTACGGVPTDMYPAPHDTPYPAIQTYYTYQPFLPHEFLYNHHRQYWRWYDGGYGATQTCVTWGGSPIRRVAEQGIAHPSNW
jgi:hypothetical protein